MHKRFLQEVINTNPKKSKSIQLFEYQKDVINQMILTDSGYFDIFFMFSNVNFYFKTTILGLSKGNGKTVIALGRIEMFLTKKDLEIEFLHPLFRKRDQFRGERVLIAVPTILYAQWLQEMISFWGEEFVVNNVFFTHHMIAKYFDGKTFEQMKSKKILLVRHNQLENLYKNPQFEDLNFHFLFLDESHLYNKKESLASHVNHVWKISASEFLNPNFNFIISGTNRNTLTDKNIKKNIAAYSRIKGEFINLPVLIENDVYFQPSKIIQVFNLDNLKNSIIFNSNSTSVILEKITSDCKIKKEQIVIDHIGNFLEKNKSIPRFEYLLKKFKKDSLQTKMSYFPLDLDKFDANHANLKSTVLFIKENIIVNELRMNSQEIVQEINQLICTIFKKLTEEDNLSEVYKKRLLEDYCPVCLEETSTNILSVCCRQKICCQCLQTILQSGKSTCPFCRQYFVRDLLELNNPNQFPKAYLKTYMDTIDQICSMFDKILVVYSTKLGGLKHIYTDYLKIPYRTLNSFSIIKSLKYIYDVRCATGKIILFLSSAFFNYGLNLDFVDCILFLNDFNEIEKEQMIGRANRYPRTKSLHVFYLKEKVY